MKMILSKLTFTILFILSLNSSLAASRSPDSLLRVFECFRDFYEILTTPAISFSQPGLTDTWGIELELRLPKQLTPLDVANHVKVFFKQKKMSKVKLKKSISSYGYEFSNYQIEYKLNGKTKIWTIPFEPSLFDEKTNQIFGVEVTTSIMSGSADEDLFVEMIHYLRGLGLTEARNYGGTHVHLGTSSLTVSQLEKIAKGFLNAETALQQRFSPDPSRSEHIGQGYLIEGYRKLREMSDKQDIILDELDDSLPFFVKGPIRYRKKYQTLEVRIFNSNLDAQELVFVKKFTKAFVEHLLYDMDFFERVAHMNFDEVLSELKLHNLL